MPWHFKYHARTIIHVEKSSLQICHIHTPSSHIFLGVSPPLPTFITGSLEASELRDNYFSFSSLQYFFYSDMTFHLPLPRQAFSVMGSEFPDREQHPPPSKCRISQVSKHDPEVSCGLLKQKKAAYCWFFSLHYFQDPPDGRMGHPKIMSHTRLFAKFFLPPSSRSGTGSFPPLGGFDLQEVLTGIYYSKALSAAIFTTDCLYSD